jgi:hypothetical protein
VLPGPWLKGSCCVIGGGLEHSYLQLGSREVAALSAAVLNTVISVTRPGGVFLHTVGLMIMQWWWHVMCSVVLD